jgi:Flp pilus assembly protein TadD
MKLSATSVAAITGIVTVCLSAPARAALVSRSVTEASPSASSLIASAKTKIEQRNLKAALADLMKAGDLEPTNVGLQRCTAVVILAIDDEAEGRRAQLGPYCSGPLK